MAYVTPDAHKIDLRAALDAQGWDVAIVESAADAWFMHELWRITSRWRPVGAELYVSFIGDPQDFRSPPRRVGNLIVDFEPARDWRRTEATSFDLHPDWPKQMAAILARAAELRNAR